MYLYHYSKEPYKELLTRRVRETFNSSQLRDIEEETKRHHYVGDYIDHISFFFDPIPAKDIADIFDEDHKVWVEGTVLYEHRIDVGSLEEPFRYDVVETPGEQEISDNTEWVDDDEEFFQNYMYEMAERKRRNGETGTSKRDLIKQIKLYRGRTGEFFKRAPETKDWDWNRLKYASTVPHVMIYPKDGVIPVENISKVVIGDDRRFNLSLECQSQWNKWMSW